MIKKDKSGRFMKGNHPKTEFKKGCIPYNKGKQFVHSGSFKKGHKINNGRRRTKEFCEKIRKANKGKILSEETKKKLRKNALKQFKNGISEETKKKLRKNALKMWKNPEFRKKLEKSLKGHIMPKEAIEKIKQARAKQILPTKDTSIEVKIQNFLKILGIEFFTHQHIKISHAYQCDILIPCMNLVIECDGDYWHKYPVGLDIDHIRTSELIKKGFKVLRLWEFEIKEMDLDKFKIKLRKCSDG